jgi:hypothetical protein
MKSMMPVLAAVLSVMLAAPTSESNDRPMVPLGNSAKVWRSTGSAIDLDADRARQQVKDRTATDEKARIAQHDVFAFVRALDAAGAKRIWPGFIPSEFPIALFDGEKTILLRHPSPPPEFSPMPGRPGALSVKGRYSVVASNSVREIGGVRTATVLATPGSNVHSTLLACVEEVFHVFWSVRHTSFRPNEMARYGYPVTDLENLRRILAEDEALARALEADSDSTAARWAAAALQIRAERTLRLADDARVFETALEMLEGPANYVSRRSLDETPVQTAERLRKGRPAEGIRWRFYDSGASICMLLDRFEPDWKARIDSQPTLTIVELLAAALARRGVAPNVFSQSDTSEFLAKATDDVAELSRRRQGLREEIRARPGARVVIDVAEGAEPLRVERFDPVNLMVLDASGVVHANYVTLRGSSGSVEVTNADFVRNSFAGTVSLTTSSGRHPLTDGIRRVTVAGIRGEPKIDRDGGVVSVEGQGVRIKLHGADAIVDGETIRITIPGRAR